MRWTVAGRTMKTEYLQFGLLMLIAYLGWKVQPAMCRHHHNHHHQNNGCHHCPPGFGVEQPCTSHRDTECAPCTPGHYSSHRSARRPCYPCSRCGLGLYVAHRCTTTNDTVCDSCHTYKGPHNEDFLERCTVRTRSAAVGTAEEADPLVAAGRTRGVPPSVVIAAGVVIGALAVILVVTCAVASSRRQCKRVNCKYPYEAVATQEAVML